MPSFNVTRQGVMTGFAALGLPFAFILCARAGRRPDPAQAALDAPSRRCRNSTASRRWPARSGSSARNAWFNFAKGLAKILLVGVVVSITLWNEHDRLERAWRR